MILREARIQRDGHGECGLLSNPTLFNNSAQLLFSGVLADIRMSLCNSFVTCLSHHYFKSGSTT